MQRAIHILVVHAGVLSLAGLVLIAACQPRAPDRDGARVPEAADSALVIGESAPSGETEALDSATTQEKTMMKEDKKFFELELDTNSPNDCSPDLPGGDFRGLVIAAPVRVPFTPGKPVGERGSFANVPVCGAFTMDVPSQPTDEPIVFHILNPVTGDEYEGPIVQLDESPEEPPPEIDPFSAEQLRGMSVTGYFNHNLVDYVRLPAGAGVYEVTVSWRGKQSNTVTVEIFEKK